MITGRRHFLKTLLQLAKLGLIAQLGLIFPRAVYAAWPEKAFHSKKLNDAILNLFEQTEINKTHRIHMNIPELAQDGAVVPVTITSSLDQIDKIAIFVEKNPVPLIMDFELTSNMEPFVTTRIKMGETDNVTVIVRANNRLYSTQKHVEVVVGGC